LQTRGVVRMRGEASPPLSVQVLADDEKLRLMSGQDVIGEWDIADLGITSLQDGFDIRVEGEQMMLKTDDDAALADELGLATASPRLARRVAASHRIEAPSEPEPEASRSNLSPIVFALGGVLVLAGGIMLRSNPETASSGFETFGEGQLGQFWVAFTIGGLMMSAVALILSIGVRWARYIAVAVIVALIVVFALAVQSAVPDSNHLLAYGFAAGGIVVGVAVLFSGSLGGED
jgi:hypothetical protein